MPSVAHSSVSKIVKTISARDIQTEYMTLEEFEAIPFVDNQRNHKERALKPIHIQKFKVLKYPHLTVYVALLPNGDMYRLDGNTRLEVWKLPTTPKPDGVRVIIYPASSKEDAKEQYEMIDAKISAKTSSDEIFSAMRENDFVPESPIVSSCKFNEALIISSKKACKGYPKSEQVKDALPTIKLFDSLLPTPSVFVTPITVAAFLSIMRDGEDALPFWRAYASGPWEEGGAVAALDAYINARDENNKRKVIWGKRDDNINVAGKCLFIYSLWATDPTAKVDTNIAKGKHGDTIIKAFKASLK